MLIPHRSNTSEDVPEITEILLSSMAALAARDSTPDTCTDIHCRTTLQIIWSCISVLIACTWVSIHANIPIPNERRWRVFAERIFLMGVTLIAPEMMVFWACRDWYSARALAQRFKLHGWTTTHAFFALMGGFALYDDEKMVCVLRVMPLHISDSEGKKIQRFLDSDSPASSESELDVRSLLAYASLIGQINKDEIDHHSHSDGFSKLITVSQTTWLVIQLLARGIQRLEATELEIMTTAFAFINLLLYFFWWYKLQGVNSHFRIQLSRSAPHWHVGGEAVQVSSLGGFRPLLVSTRTGDLSTRQSQSSKELASPTLSTVQNAISQSMDQQVIFTWLVLQRSFQANFGERFEKSSTGGKAFWVVAYLFCCPVMLVMWLAFIATGEELDYVGKKIQPFEYHQGIELMRGSVLISCISATIFGAIHCTALGLTFSSYIERILWIIASSVVVGAPATWLITCWSAPYVPLIGYLVEKTAVVYFMILCPLLYTLARLTLIVLSLVTLQNLPHGALETVQSFFLSIQINVACSLHVVTRGSGTTYTIT
ncbi:hypothetical protein BDP27DRAFT_1309318 [Rhodocollybia butyracea]|uniref:Transmembrane protein n=1 Tax=Rhodocollybia butyracea TaxID=206335 RepID=A0A9P5QAK8_9AGAR|nr:hypothetical protein BDP27DRAFT_1309318 [Rhodocollybia butyracea]